MKVPYFFDQTRSGHYFFAARFCTTTIRGQHLFEGIWYVLLMSTPQKKQPFIPPCLQAGVSFAPCDSMLAGWSRFISLCTSSGVMSVSCCLSSPFMAPVPKSKMVPVSVLGAVTAAVLWTTAALWAPSVVSCRKIWWTMHL